MATSSKRTSKVSEIFVDYMVGDVRKWFLDMHGVGEKQTRKLHLFAYSVETDNAYDDKGSVSAITVSHVIGSPEKPECINVQTANGIEYQLDPNLYEADMMVKDKEDTMWVRGWVTPEEPSATNVHEVLSRCLKAKGKVTSKREGGVAKEKVSKKFKREHTSANVVDYALEQAEHADVESGAQNLLQLDTKKLEAGLKKAEKSVTGGMDQHLKYFPFKYREFEIKVERCFEAPSSYQSRAFNQTRVDQLMEIFAKKATNPPACAYLMPVRGSNTSSLLPIPANEVKEEKLGEYYYWILDGQHTIYAAKFLRMHKKFTKKSVQNLIMTYKKRKARIVVDAPNSIAVAISSLANEQAKTLYVKQPYSIILTHLREQWKFFKCPARPAIGVSKGSSTRTEWNVSVYL